jgi:CheY-like chemotaxis protein
MARILVTDDDRYFRALVKAMLLEAGHHVGEAQDGQQCLAALADLPFDLLIVDILMPKMDGIEIIRQVRTRNKQIKILAMSGGGTHVPLETSLRMAGQFGANAYLTKPFSGPQLYAKLSELLVSETM